MLTTILIVLLIMILLGRGGGYYTYRGYGGPGLGGALLRRPVGALLGLSAVEGRPGVFACWRLGLWRWLWLWGLLHGCPGIELSER
jgi:hypothetical protein